MRYGEVGSLMSQFIFKPIKITDLDRQIVNDTYERAGLPKPFKLKNPIPEFKKIAEREETEPTYPFHP